MDDYIRGGEMCARAPYICNYTYTGTRCVVITSFLVSKISSYSAVHTRNVLKLLLWHTNA